jgi:hypothetical protein
MICVVITFEKALQMVYFIVADDVKISLFRCLLWQVEEDGGAGRSDAGGDAVAVQMAAVQV